MIDAEESIATITEQNSAGTEEISASTNERLTRFETVAEKAVELNQMANELK